jgi:hypothetical protein
MAQKSVVTADDLQRWLDAYKSAWEARSPEQAAALFAADTEYYETPFAEPFRGRDGVADYWRRVTAGQRDIVFTSRIVGVSGNIGVAQWSATFTALASGAAVALDGVFVLEFDADKRCGVLREWWHAR